MDSTTTVYVYIGHELIYANMFLEDEGWTRDEIVEDALDSLAMAVYKGGYLSGGSVDDLKGTLASYLDMEDLREGLSDTWVDEKYDFRIDIRES